MKHKFLLTIYLGICLLMIIGCTESPSPKSPEDTTETSGENGSFEEPAGAPTTIPGKEITPTPTDMPTPIPTDTPTPTPTDTPTPTPTDTPTPTPTDTPTPTPTNTPTPTPTQIPSSEMFMETYFCILTEELRAYDTPELGGALVNSGFAKYTSCFDENGNEIFPPYYDPDDFKKYQITDDKVIFTFAGDELVKGQPEFTYERPLSEALAFMYYNPDGSVRYVPCIRTDLDVTGKKLLAFTFDDGPSPANYEKDIIEIFEKYNGKCTFFFQGSKIGKTAETANESAKKVIDTVLSHEGFEIESHTFTHHMYSKGSGTAAEYFSDINKANMLLAKMIGHSPRYVRNGGGFNREYMWNAPMPIMCWFVDSEDSASSVYNIKNGETAADRNKRAAEHCAKIILDNAKDGRIILEHSTYPYTATVLETVLPELEKDGYLFVTLEELFYYKNVIPENGRTYFAHNNSRFAVIPNN